MRVAWDARPLFANHLRGIGHYSHNLLRALAVVEPTLEVVLFRDADGAHAVPDPRERVVGPSIGYRWQLWERLGLPWAAMRTGCTLLHSLANTTPPRAPLPRIVTVHDVIPFLADFVPSGPTLAYFTSVMPAAVRRADLVITDSEWSRNDIASVFRVPADRIRVIPLASSPSMQRPEPATLGPRLDALGIRRPYIVALAATARRKNTRGVLSAFAAIAARDARLQLVLTGVEGALIDSIPRLVHELGIPPSRVTLLPFVDDGTLAVLYAGAEVFLFLSLYEGFGIPLLDAMRCGAPVVASNRASCPEVAGTAASLVDPTNASAVADAVLDIAFEPAAARAARIERGHARERAFTWEDTARATRDAYRQVARG
jgi:glycosyltransferase involved in cell wall biosynthesis